MKLPFALRLPHRARPQPPAAPPGQGPDANRDWAGLAAYPPCDPGLPVLPAPVLLQAAQPQLARLRELVLGEAGPPARWLEPVETLVEHVHLLPASDAEHHAAPAGLFHLCLGLAVASLQAAGGRIFVPQGSAETRHALEPRWRHATFLAGLAWPAGRTLAQLAVTTPEGAEWPRFSVPLLPWLHASGAARYHAVWWPGPSPAHGAVGSALLAALVPRATFDWLAEGDPRIVHALQAFVLGDGEQPGTLAEVVRTSFRRLLEADLATRRSRYGRLTIGCHPEPYLLDALRCAVEEGEWAPGTAPLVWNKGALCLAWPTAHPALRARLDRMGVPGLPRSAASIADMLGRAGALVPAADGQWLHALTEGHDSATALRFLQPAAVLGQACPTPQADAAGPVAPAAARGASVPASPRSARPSRGVCPAPLAQALALLVQQQRAGDGRSVRRLDCGVAVAVDWIEAQVPGGLLPLLRMLERQGWLGEPPHAVAGARVHALAFSDATKPAILLRPEGARSLGFDDDGCVP